MTPEVFGLKIKNAEKDFKEKKIMIKLGKSAKCFCVLYNNAKNLMFKPSLNKFCASHNLYNVSLILICNLIESTFSGL